MNESFVTIGAITISINTNNGLGHSLIWPYKDEIISKLLDELHIEFSEENKSIIRFDIERTEPGCIKVTLEIALLVAAIASSGLTIAEKTIIILDKLNSTILEQTIEVPDTSDQYSATILHCSKRGLCYGPVKRNDTLYEIARKLNPNGVSTNKAMVALYKYNLSAFYDENINNLIEGAYLSLPISPKYPCSKDADTLVDLHARRWSVKK